MHQVQYSWPRIDEFGEPNYFSESSDAFMAFTLAKSTKLYIDRKFVRDTTLAFELWCEAMIGKGEWASLGVYKSRNSLIVRRLCVQGTLKTPVWEQRLTFERVFGIKCMRFVDIEHMVSAKRRLGCPEAYLVRLREVYCVN